MVLFDVTHVVSMAASSSGCFGDDWSDAGSAATYSQLAGVLAGFVFTALILVLGRNRTLSDLHTLSLFLTAFIVLALASYLYGVLSGDNLAAACGRAATEDQIASGLLGLGATVLVSGLSWLLAGHATPNEGDPGVRPRSTIVQLVRLIRGSDEDGAAVIELASRLVVYGVGLVAIALLAVTAASYVGLSFSGNAPAWLQLCVQVIPVAAFLVVAIMKSLLPRILPKRGRRAVADRRLGKATAIYTLLSITYAVLGTVLSGTLANIPVADWTPVPPAIAVIALVVSTAMPIPIILAFVYLVPRFPTSH